jgi:hypothetical protein
LGGAAAGAAAISVVTGLDEIERLVLPLARGEMMVEGLRVLVGAPGVRLKFPEEDKAFPERFR